MNIEETLRLHETFQAYVSAETAATRALIGYKIGEVTEAEVHGLQRLQADALGAHLAAMGKGR